MLKLLQFAGLCLVTVFLAQAAYIIPDNVTVGTQQKPHASSVFDTVSTSRGSRPCPSMTEVQRDAISSPATGLCVYNTNTNLLNYYTGSTWTKASGEGVLPWVTATNYLQNEVVSYNGFLYIALTAHTSGTFATDLANGEWLELADNLNRKTNGSVATDQVAVWADSSGDEVASRPVSISTAGAVSGVTDLAGSGTGSINISSPVVAEKISVVSTTEGSTPCPDMTQAQRDLLTPTEGECIYNSDLMQLQLYNGSIWTSVGGGLSNWLTATDYEAGDVVYQGGYIYISLTTHTSGVFATDLTNNNWRPVISGPALSGNDECVVRWNGNATPLLQSSTFCITDAGVATGLVSIQLSGLASGAVAFGGSDTTLSGDATYLFWDDTNKRLAVGEASGENSVTINGTSTGSTLSVHATDGTNNAEFLVLRHSDTAANNARLYGARSRGTHATPTVVSSGDSVMRLTGLGFDGTDYVPMASVDFEVDAATGNNDMPGRISFKTTADGAETLTERMTLNSSGVLSLTGQLNVDNLQFDGNSILTTSGNITINPTGAGAITLTDAVAMSSTAGVAGLLSLDNNISMTSSTARISKNNATSALTLTGGNGLDTSFGATINLYGSGAAGSEGVLLLNAGSGSGDIRFRTNVTTRGSIGSGGGWTIGTDGGTATHIVNGNLNGSGSGNFTGTWTVGSNLIGSGSGQFSNGLSIMAQNGLRLYDTDNGQYTELKATGSVTTNYVLSLPPAQGSGYQSLVNDGSGNLYWSYPVVANITNTESWTPTGSITVNSTYTGKKWYHGDRGHYEATITMSGSGNGGNVTINLPSGDTIDTSKLDTSAGAILGIADLYDSSSGTGDKSLKGMVQPSTTTSVQISMIDESSGSSHYTDTVYVTGNYPVALAAGDVIHIKFDVPLVGRDSGVQAITDTTWPVATISYGPTTNCSPDLGTGVDSNQQITDSDCVASTSGPVTAFATSTALGGYVYLKGGWNYEACFQSNHSYDTTGGLTQFINLGYCSGTTACTSPTIMRVATLGSTESVTDGHDYVNQCGVISVATDGNYSFVAKETTAGASSVTVNRLYGNTSDRSMAFTIKPLSATISASLRGVPQGPYTPTVTASSCAGWTTTTARTYFKVYQLDDNEWYSDFHVVGTHNSLSTCQVSIDGINFQNSVSCAGIGGGVNNWSQAFTNGDATIEMRHGAAQTSSYWSCNGIKLDSKPTFVP